MLAILTPHPMRPKTRGCTDSYAVRYERPRTLTDPNKRMLFTDLTVLDAESATNSAVRVPGQVHLPNAPRDAHD